MSNYIGQRQRTLLPLAAILGVKRGSCLSPALKSLGGFYIWAVCHMVGNMPTWTPDGMWMYPSSRDVLNAVGLQMIGHYIGVHQETIARFIVDRPLLALCRDGEKKRGSVCRTFFWEQPLSIDVAESLPGPGDKDDESDDQ